MATLAGSLFSGASNNPTGEVPFSPVHDDEEEEETMLVPSCSFCLLMIVPSQLPTRPGCGMVLNR